MFTISIMADQASTNTPVAEELPTSSSEPVTQAPVDNNVNFEKEREFFENNRDNINNRIASLQREMTEEQNLSETLATRDATDGEELRKIRQFLSSNADEIASLHSTVTELETSLKELVSNNKMKSTELREQSAEYAALVNSDGSKNVAAKIKSIRTILQQLEDFLVREGVQGPNNPRQ